MVDQIRQQELNEALELFHFAFRAFTKEPDAMLAQHGLQRVHHRILYFVGRNAGLSVNELLRILGVSKQALNGPLRMLKEQALIETTTDAIDKRIKRLTLSEAGSVLEKQLSACQRELMASVFTQLGPITEQHWRDVMKAIAQTQFSSESSLLK